MGHIRKALQTCHFPPWALNTLQDKLNHKHNIHNGQTSTDNQSNNNNSGTNNNNNKNMSIVVPYIHGLGKRFNRTCNSLGIWVHFTWTNTIKTLLIAPEDMDSKLQKSGVTYMFLCPHINCLEEYIGESGLTFRDRLKENLRAPSPIHHHSHSTGHPLSLEYVNIVDRESPGT